MSEDQSVSNTTGDTSASHNALRAIGWVSVGLGIAAVGLFVGRELRKRYQFNHRTPYDFYSNAGAAAASEFGMGI
jgi:hypothetical protein